MNILKKIPFLFFVLLNIACNNKNTISNDANKKQTKMQSATYEIIGMCTLDNITYKSIYTKENLENAAIFYQKKMSMESSRSDMILLFYDKKDKTPTSKDLKFEEKRLNNNLIGGIKKKQGKYYILNLNEKNQLIKGKEIIQTFSTK